MLKLSLYDNSDAYILVKETIPLLYITSPYNAGKNVIFKNSA